MLQALELACSILGTCSLFRIHINAHLSFEMRSFQVIGRLAFNLWIYGAVSPVWKWTFRLGCAYIRCIYWVFSFTCLSQLYSLRLFTICSASDDWNFLTCLSGTSDILLYYLSLFVRSTFSGKFLNVVIFESVADIQHAWRAEGWPFHWIRVFSWSKKTFEGTFLTENKTKKAMEIHDNRR